MTCVIYKTVSVMEGDHLRSKIFPRVLTVFLCLHVSVFFAITLLQFRYTQDLEDRLAERKEAVLQLSKQCNVSRQGDRHDFEQKKIRVLRALKEMAKHDKMYEEVAKEVHPRQDTSLTFLLQNTIQQQESMLEQKCSKDTIICIKGNKGESGLKGESGSAGTKGDKGDSGMKGLAGKDGAPGDVGGPGLPGLPGQKGVPGPKGLPGLKGDPGEAGSDGTPGLKGDPGLDGVKGDVGERGFYGLLGDKGATGTDGGDGDKGAKGLAGEKGEIGESGLLGPPAIVSTTGCDCLKSPEFINNSSETRVIPLGSKLTDICLATGNPTPTLTVYKKESRGCFKNGTSTVGNTTNLLDFFSPVDTGTYTCEAQNSLGTVYKDVTLSSSNSNDVVTCAFEGQGTCYWHQSQSDDIDWIRGTGSTTTLGTGPSFDHTYQSRIKGHYMYLKASNSVSPDVAARLESLYIPTDRIQCLSLWYNMHGSDIGKLAILSKDCDGKETELWSLNGDQGANWQEVKVNISANSKGQQFVIEAMKGKGIYGDIAIDDIHLSDTPCPQSDIKPRFLIQNETIQVTAGQAFTLNCSVESKPAASLLWDKGGSCQANPLGSNSKNTYTVNAAKLSDGGVYKCTANNRIGTAEKYITVNINDPKSTCNFDDGSLSKCRWNQTTDDRFDFKFRSISTPSSDTGPSSDHTHGNSDGQYIFLESSNPARVGDSAGLQSELLPGGSQICLDFWYNMYGAEMGDLNVYLQANPKSTCNFDDGSLSKCRWNQTTDDRFDFKFRSISTPSSDTGPSSDHTHGNSDGQYIFLESSNPARVGDSAGLQSELLPGGSQICLDFWYNMYGAEMGDLNVYLQECSKKEKVWSISGDQGTEWHTKCVKVENRTKDFNIIIQGTVGTGYHSDVAIDDVKLKVGDSCKCSIHSYTDFETALKDWKQSTSDDFDWDRGSGETGSSSTGPSGDHTTGAGHYMYTEASSPRSPGDVAELISKTLSGGQEYCFEMWYNMYGSSMGTLSVYTQGTNKATLLTKTGDQGTSWHRFRTTIPSQTTPFTIHIEGIRGNGYYSDMAVDDIRIDDGHC